MKRFIDVVGSGLLLLLLSPLLLYRATASYRRSGHVFDAEPHLGYQGVPFRQWSFSSDGIGKHWPVLINILNGDVSWTGVRALTPEESRSLQDAVIKRHLTFKPGIISAYGIKKSVGLDYDDELTTDHDFFSRASAKDRLGLFARACMAYLLDSNGSALATSMLHFWGIDITNTTMHEALDWIEHRVSHKQKSLLFFVNPACLNIASHDEDYSAVLQQADRILADGIGLKIGSRLLNQALKANVNGTDLFPRLCERAAIHGYSLFLLGGQPGVAAKAAETMQQRYPGLEIAGTRDGFFTPEQEAEIIADINASGAAILLVGFGAPKQELWLSRVKQSLASPVCMGVGGLFDYYSGRIPRAPLWLREMGLEWAWRFCQEPMRMWRRYLVGNPLFIYRVLRQRQQGWVMSEDLLRHELLQRYSRLSYLQGRLPLRMLLKRHLWRLIVSGSYILKRLVDIVAASSMLILLMPVFLITALSIYINSPGPILYKQTRVGQWGKLYTMLKFRSMYMDADQRLKELIAQNEMQGGVLFKMKNDPRITPVGRFIRKMSIDELPQLWNVLKGDMSLVGPRPALPSEVDQYSLHDRQRLEVIPGITCIWQVSGRSDIPFPEQVQLDVQYIDSQFIWLDIKLLFQTIPAVLFSRGAY
jgi:exopolysaccharide biosynthesis WecB/TagA/CpsF family protein